MNEVAPEVMETAQQAARRSGQPLREWLNAVILDAAARTGVAPPVAQDGRDGTRVVGFNERLDQLAERLDRIERGVAFPVARAVGRPKVEALARPERMSPVAPVPDAVAQDESPLKGFADAFALLNARLDQLMGEAPGAPSVREPQAVAPVHGDARRLSPAEEGERGLAAAPAPRPDDVHPLEPIRRASDPVRRPENAAPKPLTAARDLAVLEPQLHHITAQIEALRMCWNEQDGAAKSSAVGDDSGRAASATASKPRAPVAAADPAPVPEADVATLSGLERGLADVRDALEALPPGERLEGIDAGLRLLSRKIELLAAPRPAAEPPRPVKTAAAAELHALPTGNPKGAAERRNDIATIGANVYRQLTDEPGRQPAPARRSDPAAPRVEAAPANPPQPESAAVADKVEAETAAEAEDHGFGHLEQEINRLAQKLETSELNADLGAIKGKLADLMMQLRRANTLAADSRHQRARPKAIRRG